MSTQTDTPATTSTTPTSSSVATLGARLAAVSRGAQGFTVAVDDPAVLAELRELCVAPRPLTAFMTGKREGPAP